MSLKESNSALYPKDRIIVCPVCGVTPSTYRTVYWSRESPHIVCQECLMLGAAHAAKLALAEKEAQVQQRNAGQVKN